MSSEQRSGERKISAVPFAAEPPSVETRLAGLEAEATRLRAEVAMLQEDIRWLAGEGGADDPALSHGWLARGWVRASMLMAVVAVVAFVSVPYLLHVADTPTHQTDSRPGGVPSGITPAEATDNPAPVAVPVRKAPAQAYIPAPTRVRAAEVPEPEHVRPETPPSAPRPLLHRPAPEPAAGRSNAVRGESP